MAKTNDNSSSGGFGGILKSLIFTDEHIEKMEKDKQSSSSSPLPQTNSSFSPSLATAHVNSNIDGSAIAKKMMEYIESLNQPGIDFFEVWNAVEEFGGINLQNLQNAYKALYIGSGKTLTVDKLIDSGEFYKNSLETLVKENINKQAAEKQNLQNSQASEKATLESEVSDLSNQLTQIQNQLNSKRALLSQVDGRYQTKLNELDQKIQIGQTQLSSMLGKIENILDLAKKLN